MLIFLVFWFEHSYDSASREGWGASPSPLPGPLVDPLLNSSHRNDGLVLAACIFLECDFDHWCERPEGGGVLQAAEKGRAKSESQNRASRRAKVLLIWLALSARDGSCAPLGLRSRNLIFNAMGLSSYPRHAGLIPAGYREQGGYLLMPATRACFRRSLPMLSFRCKIQFPNQFQGRVSS